MEKQPEGMFASPVHRAGWVTAGGLIPWLSTGSLRVAMKEGSAKSYLLGDHDRKDHDSGSTSITANASGVRTGELMFKAWGEIRYTWGTTPTEFRYTGQYSYTADFGLMYYGARWYDSYLGRFAQADTIIPGAGNVAAWDRYAGMLNNPVRYTDPSGHETCDADGYCGKDENKDPGVGYHTYEVLYGVTFDIEFTKGDKQTILQALSAVGRAFAAVLNNKYSVYDAFKMVFGKILFNKDNS